MQQVATGYGLIEGPVWDPARGLYFSDVTNGGVFQAQLVARDDANVPLGFPINATLTIANTGFETFSQDFTAPAGTTRFEINFFAITGADSGSSSSVVVDNVQIIPEPSTWALLLGGVSLFARKRARGIREAPCLD